MDGKPFIATPSNLSLSEAGRKQFFQSRGNVTLLDACAHNRTGRPREARFWREKGGVAITFIAQRSKVSLLHRAVGPKAGIHVQHVDLPKTDLTAEIHLVQEAPRRVLSFDVFEYRLPIRFIA